MFHTTVWTHPIWDCIVVVDKDLSWLYEYFKIFLDANFFVSRPNIGLLVLKMFVWMRGTDLNRFHPYIY